MSWAYLYTFLQTCLIEFPFYFYFLRGRFGFTRSLVAVFALNALTHPIVFFFLMTLKFSLLGNILLAEAFAFGIEIWACFYFLRLNFGRAFVAATTANLASWQLGSVLTYLLFF